MLGAQKSLFPLDKSALKLEIYPDPTGTLLSIKTTSIQSDSEDMGADGRGYFALGVYPDRNSTGPLLCQVRSLGRDYWGAFEAIECIDFHFNDKLKLTYKLRLSVRSKKKFKITKKMKRLILLRQRFRP